MKIKTIRLKKHTELSSEQVVEVKNIIIMTALFAAGIIAGTGLIRKGSNTECLSDFASIFNVYIDSRSEMTFIRMFFDILIVNMIYISVIFFAGLSCIGIPVIILMPIIKGIGYGILSGYLFTQYKMTGIGYYLLTVFPSAVFLSSVLILSSCSAGIMSKEILAVILEKKQPNSSVAIKYIKKYMIYFTGTVIVSAVESMLIKAFSYLFVF